MAELKDRLRADLTTAMKSQDKLRTATLRMLLAAIQTEEVSGKVSRELSDDDVLRTPTVLSGSTADIADTIRHYRDTYGVTYFIVQQAYAEAFAKVIAELR